MNWIAAKKWPCLALAAYLALAVMGTFTLSAAEILLSDEPEGSQHGSGKMFAAVDRALDCLAAETPAIGKARFSSPFPLRAGAMRLFAPAGTYSDGVCLGGASLQAAKKYQIPIAKSTILLKLRI